MKLWVSSRTEMYNLCSIYTARTSGLDVKSNHLYACSEQKKELCQSFNERFSAASAPWISFLTTSLYFSWEKSLNCSKMTKWNSGSGENYPCKMPFTIKYTLNLKAAGHDGACPSIIQPLSVSPVIVNSIMTTNDLSRSGWTDSLKRPWKRKLGSPSYHKSPVGACYITWDMHMDKPLETLKGILKIISRVHGNRSKPTPSHDGEVAAKNCQNDRHTCTWIIISICWKPRASADGGRTREILQASGLSWWCKGGQFSLFFPQQSLTAPCLI